MIKNKAVKCRTGDYEVSTEKILFGQIGEQDIYSYIIRNKSGAFVEIIDFGCRIRQIAVPDINGDIGNIVRCCNAPEEYLDPEYQYDGAVIGRCANRIKEGMYCYENRLYMLSRNEGINHVHGGLRGFHNMMWECTKMKDDEIVFSGFQAHNTEGYPGNMRMSISFKFTDEYELSVKMVAQTDRDTIFNPTLHPFFNLNKPGTDASLHYLKIYADKYTPLDKEGIPTGEICDLPGHMDFRKTRRIDLGLKHIKMSKDLMDRHGYDHNYVLKYDTVNEVKAAELISAESGRKMTVYTSLPGLQFYSGNFMNIPHGAVCLEPQYFPDAINNRGRSNKWQCDTSLKAGYLANFDVRYKFSLITSEEAKKLAAPDTIFTARK